jgi:hypothetical protein
MKLRIVKEEGVYRILGFYRGGLSSDGSWEYCRKAMEKGEGFLSFKRPIDFKTQKDAEDFIEHNFISKVVKEYNIG